jgi:oxygen-independent coproporphyrinogen-3 oxidase
MLDYSTKVLIAKYNRPGPRYTSYPTAVQFSDTSDTRGYFAECASATGPLSIYIHLPFCESLCWFCACTTVITLNNNLADTYLDHLEREMALTAPLIGADRRTVTQVHLGGGSPSFLSPAQLQRLGQLLQRHFHITADAECSVELDPRTLSREKVEVLASIGFRRASFGVQDVDPAVQKAVHRVQPDTLNRAAISWIREAGFDSLNIDLIYGLPKQSTTSFRRTLETVLSYQPDRFAVFSYAHVPWVAPAQKILERNDLPAAEEKFAMLLLTIDQLTAAGYHYLGMDHFAKADDELFRALADGTLHRNFQGYTTRSGAELCGMGMSAISQSATRYRQNHKTLDAWQNALAEGRLPLARGCSLSSEDLLRRHVIMRIMCSGSIRFADFHASHGIDFTTHFADALQQLQEPAADGLVAIDDHGL